MVFITFQTLKVLTNDDDDDDNNNNNNNNNNTSLQLYYRPIRNV